MLHKEGRLKWKLKVKPVAGLTKLAAAKQLKGERLLGHWRKRGEAFCLLLRREWLCKSESGKFTCYFEFNKTRQDNTTQHSVNTPTHSNTLSLILLLLSTAFINIISFISLTCQVVLLLSSFLFFIHSFIHSQAHEHQLFPLQNIYTQKSIIIKQQILILIIIINTYKLVNKYLYIYK